MDFWRSGRARSHRSEPIASRGKKRGLLYTIRHMYFPPWVPVAFIIVVVFGILGLLFVTRSATGAPRIGEDHWHAQYTYYACGEKQPPAPTWESGVHTHGDGIVHIHPFQTFEEGAGARLVKWFDYGSGELSQSEIRMPGSSKTFKNGDVCAEGTPEAGSEGKLQVFVNGKKLDDWSRYIPHDGDRIQLVFGKEEQIVQLDDRQVIDESEATRTIEMTITGDEATTEISPSSPSVTAGETVKILVHNQGALSHGIRIAGPDGEYDTADDFVVVPVGSDPKDSGTSTVLEPGADGFTVVRFDNPGQIKFEDPTTTDPTTTESYVTGNIVVEGAASPTASAGAGGQGEQSADVLMQDSVFEPNALTFEADKTFSINLTNNGQFVHNLRIDGADHQFDTEDDIIAQDVSPGGGTGSTEAATLEAGSYRFRDDFNPTLMTGTLTVE
jgi:uncharacterized cupredoxin-like copper-binding protein